MKVLKNKKFIAAVSIILVVAIVFTGVIGIAGFFGVKALISGEEIDCESEVAAYNSSKVNYSELGVGITEEALSQELDDLDAKLASILATVNIDSLVYTDAVATLVARFTAELTEKDLASIEFSSLKKTFPAAYDYVTAQQQSGATWETLGTIPFGIAAGDKEAFIKACGAGAAHMGDTLLEVVLCAPSSYYDVLVPTLEATHTGNMPSFFGFVADTGLSASKRIEFMAEKILAIIEPVKTSPLTFLCGILPDFLINYNKSCDFMNANPKIAEKAKLSMPAIDSIIQELISALGLTAPPVDYDYLSRMGTASVGESGGNGGERVYIEGDREIIFAYLANYITGLFTYGNNYTVIEKLVTKDMKSPEIQNSPFASILSNPAANSLIAALIDIIAKLKPRQAVDVNAQVEAYNAEEKDFSSFFAWPATEENVTSVLDTIEAKVVEALATADLEGMLFTDDFATTVSKLTADLCGKELTDLSFAALKKSFPDAYNYISALQAEGKTWKDVETIPFGITAGDREMFIKACGAGAEHFGDALAMCILVDPHSYDEALVPLLESFHTGPMPTLEEFVSGQGLDGAKRMEDVVIKVLTIMEPIKANPVTYLCDILPDLILSYNKAAAAMGANAIQPLHLPDINGLLKDIVGDLGITLPDHDFTSFEEMGVASVAESGVPGGQRMEIKGDREVVFMGLAKYLVDVVSYEGNMSVVVNLLTNVLGIDSSIIDSLTGLFA